MTELLFLVLSALVTLLPNDSPRFSGAFGQASSTVTRLSTGNTAGPNWL